MQNHHEYAAPSPRPVCPDKCARARALQWDLTRDLLNNISKKAREEVVASSGRAFICPYCGCLYIREGSHTRRLGMLMAGWHSERFPRD